VFDLATKIRVMEFQWKHRLKADGIVGKITAGHLSKTASTYPIPAHPSGRCIVVDLVNRVLHAYRDGVEEVTTSARAAAPLAAAARR